MTFKGSRTQIVTDEVVTDGTAIVYTVPVGKVFKIVEAMLKTDAGATGTGTIAIRNESDAHVRHICFVDVRSNSQGIVDADHFQPSEPVKLPAGYDITVISDSASLEAEADIFDWEEDAEGF